MPNCRLNSKGENYLNNPPRDRIGRIESSYYKNAIILYLLINEKYIPQEFKNYIESLNILKDKDWELMHTRNYPKWKHWIDAAKQQLLIGQILMKNPDGTISISNQKLNEILKEFSNYIEIKLETFEFEISETEEYPSKQITVKITRRIRDTALSYKVKEERNYQCQVCGLVLVISGKGYAEAHHLKPLGQDGPDIKSNILVLCPNHHVLFDGGAIAIDPHETQNVIDCNGKKLAQLKPPLPKQEFIDYHYEKIYQKM